METIRGERLDKNPLAKIPEYAADTCYIHVYLHRRLYSRSVQYINANNLLYAGHLDKLYQTCVNLVNTNIIWSLITRMHCSYPELH